MAITARGCSLHSSRKQNPGESEKKKSEHCITQLMFAGECSSVRTMLMQCESCIFYELSNVWQVNDVMCRDILAVHVIWHLEHQVYNICRGLSCSCSWMLNLLKFPIPNTILNWSGNAFPLGASLSRKFIMLYILLRQRKGTLCGSSVGLETLCLCKPFG